MYPGGPARARLCKLLRIPETDSKESIPKVYVAWRGSMTTLFLSGPPGYIGWRNRFLGLHKSLPIQALLRRSKKIHWSNTLGKVWYKGRSMLCTPSWNGSSRKCLSSRNEHTLPGRIKAWVAPCQVGSRLDNILQGRIRAGPYLAR